MKSKIFKDTQHDIQWQVEFVMRCFVTMHRAQDSRPLLVTGKWWLAERFMTRLRELSDRAYTSTDVLERIRHYLDRQQDYRHISWTLHRVWRMLRALLCYFAHSPQDKAFLLIYLYAEIDDVCSPRVDSEITLGKQALTHCRAPLDVFPISAASVQSCTLYMRWLLTNKTMRNNIASWVKILVAMDIRTYYWLPLKFRKYRWCLPLWLTSMINPRDNSKGIITAKVHLTFSNLYYNWL